jgi:signal transduction histidine kinase
MAALSEWKIVLVDDEADIREVMAIALEDAGYDVHTASDGKAGIRLCETVLPQIVITDIRMPGMNGIQVLEEIKRLNPDIEVIVFSAFGEMDLAIRALQLDASDFITKPVNDDALHMALKRARDRYSARKQLKDYTALLEREFAAQARILHQDKMISLGRLAASVVHEINNPLSGILNYARLMIRILNRGPLAEDRREKFEQYLKLVESETSRCSQIVSSLLTFSRKSSLTFESVSIADLIERCTILSQHKLQLQHISLETRIEPDIPTVEGDFNQLQQCVINLIFNAIDAMPEGGTLTLAGGYEHASARVIISVKDTGSGISEADLPHIFEPFFTTKKEGYGVGLGLSTVYGIMEHHKGTVSVESRPGQGSTFKLELPVKAEGLTI